MPISTKTTQNETHHPAFLGAEVIALPATSTEECLKDFMKSICERSNQNEEEQSFFMADLGEVYRQHRRWEKSLGKVKPFYGMYPILGPFRGLILSSE